MTKVNSGNGTLGRFIQDSTIAENINQTIVNLKKSSKGLDENMHAAKENFLFRGYFKRKEKAAEKVKADSALKKAEVIKESDKKKK
jgi:phospholipid/cholesterol/gamma-HCH transport system substrate-binding protein